MYKYLSISLVLLLFVSCSDAPEAEIGIEEGIFAYQEFEPILANIGSESKSTQKEIQFWEDKLQGSPSGYLYLQKLGAAYAQNFKETGEVESLLASNQNFQEALERTTGRSKSKTLLSLSSNAIKLHKFQEAFEYAKEAEYHNSDTFGSLMMQFDALMELGHYDLAHGVLTSANRPESFEHLVRMAKYQDHLGNLDYTIVLMETALSKVPESESARMLWTMASLGDYYGHSGNIEKSYDTFRTVLEIDPEYAHAWRGIAWIAYSHDDKPKQALEIVERLISRTELPDNYLLAAEINRHQGFNSRADSLIAEFLSEAEKEKYGDMYASYLVDEYASQDPGKAMDLALRDLDGRKTPQAFAAFAWAQFHNGHPKEAWKTIEKEVRGKTFEPKLLLRIAQIARHNEEGSLARELFSELQDASFELGPLTAKSIGQMN